MAHLLGTQSLSILADSRKLLEKVTLGIEDSSRIGILGPNGTGKSTLLRLIAGLQEPDGGQITKREGVTVLVLDQADYLDPNLRVIDAVRPGLDKYGWASNPVIRDIHAGLLADIRLDAEVGALSGGQHRRVVLAKVFAAPSDIVCLDEPTGHLDIEGVAWLAAHLNARFAKAGAVSTLLIVTHNRWFLDIVCEHIWKIVPGINSDGDRPQIPGHVDIYEDSCVAYTLARTERARQADVAAHKRTNLLTKELAWLQRKALTRTLKPKPHIATAETFIADVPPPRDAVELVKMANARLGKDVLDFKELSLAFTRADGTKSTILNGVIWCLAPAEHVGIVGVNGVGRTTLLGLLRKNLHPDSGRVKRGKTMKVATLSRDTHEPNALADMRVVKAATQISQTCRVDDREVDVMQMSERMSFARQRAYTRICEVSGGERRRFQLIRLLMTEPNILLLDEPTNDLDTDTLAAMEDLLSSFPGAFVVVSHDHCLLERVTDHRVVLLDDGKLHALPNGVGQYPAIREQGQREDSSTSPRAQADVAQSPLASEAKALSRLKGAARHAAQKEANRVERRVERLRAQCTQVEERLAQLGAAVVREAETIEELEKVSVEHPALITQIDEPEEAWLEAVEFPG